MFSEELDSFLMKFHQLRKAGRTAHLDIDTHAGQAWVGLRVMLGSDKNQQQFQSSSSSRHRSPSYYRRQERRKAAKQSVDNEAEKASESTSDKKNEAVEVLNHSSQREAAQATFDCELCDFVSNRKNGVAVHMNRKHQNIEQLDGNTTFSEPRMNHFMYRKYGAHVLEEIDQEVENFLKNESNVGEVNLETWEEIIEEIKMCKVLILSEKKEEIWKVIEARQKCLFAWNTENLK